MCPKDQTPSLGPQIWPSWGSWPYSPLQRSSWCLRSHRILEWAPGSAHSQSTSTTPHRLWTADTQERKEARQTSGQSTVMNNTNKQTHSWRLDWVSLPDRCSLWLIQTYTLKTGQSSVTEHQDKRIRGRGQRSCFSENTDLVVFHSKHFCSPHSVLEVLRDHIKTLYTSVH